MNDESFASHPVRFLILDLSKVDGLDYSAAEAFARIDRVLKVKGVRMVLCGFTIDSKIGQSLKNFELFEDDEKQVEFFEVLNAALEYCENDLLKAFYQRREAMIQEDNDGSERPKSAPQGISSPLYML